MVTGDGEGEETFTTPPATLPSPESIPTEPLPWLDYALDQAMLFKATAADAFHSTVRTATSRLSEIKSTASAHSLHTLEMIRDYVGEADVLAFAKMKEGVLIAAAHPSVSCTVAAGLGVIGLKRPRRFLFCNVRRFFTNEEALLLSAEAKAKALKQTFANMKHEGRKLEERALLAENDLLSGKTRLRQAGRQIQGLIHSIYRVENETMGLKEIVRELPRKDASLFRSKISSLTSQVKREKSSLGKEVSKITGYGIPI